jgi:hypothetical protein
VIYVLNGIGEEQLVALVEGGQLPHVKFGNPDMAPEGTPVLDIDYMDKLMDSYEKIVVDAATLLKSRGFELGLAEQRYIRIKPEGTGIIINEPNDEFCAFQLTGLYTDPDCYMSRLVEDLAAAGITTTWELDREMTLRWQDRGEPNAIDKRIEAAMPQPWPMNEPPHSHKCDCLCCSLIRIRYLRQDEKKRQDELGWTGHIVSSDSTSPTGFNAHTHMDEKFGHPDFQIVLAVPSGLANHILSHLVERVKAGAKLKAGDQVEGVFGDDKRFGVLLMDATENGRPVLRAIIPDEHGNQTQEELAKAVADEKTHPDFALQFQLVDEPAPTTT